MKFSPKEFKNICYFFAKITNIIKVCFDGADVDAVDISYSENRYCISIHINAHHTLLNYHKVFSYHDAKSVINAMHGDLIDRIEKAMAVADEDHLPSFRMMLQLIK